jgi:hypothetical protein
VSVIVHPEFPPSEECYGCISRSEVLSILCNEQILTVKEKLIDVIHNSGSAVIGIWPCTTICLFDWHANCIEIVD